MIEKITCETCGIPEFLLMQLAFISISIFAYLVIKYKMDLEKDEKTEEKFGLIQGYFGIILITTLGIMGKVSL